MRPAAKTSILTVQKVRKSLAARQAVPIISEELNEDYAIMKDEEPDEKSSQECVTIRLQRLGRCPNQYLTYMVY